MTKVNIIFDDVLDDVDIIAIPDEIAYKIESIGQEFLKWVSTSNDPYYWVVVNGRKCNNSETEGFIKWLNYHYCLGKEKAYIISTNTNFCPEYKIIEF